MTMAMTMSPAVMIGLFLVLLAAPELARLFDRGRALASAVDRRSEAAQSAFMLAPPKARIDLTSERHAIDGLDLPAVLPAAAAVPGDCGLIKGDHLPRLHTLRLTAAISVSIDIVHREHPRTGLFHVDGMDTCFRSRLQEADPPEADGGDG